MTPRTAQFRNYSTEMMKGTSDGSAQPYNEQSVYKKQLFIYRKYTKRNWCNVVKSSMATGFE
jgi:hypothetical protein